MATHVEAVAQAIDGECPDVQHVPSGRLEVSVAAQSHEMTQGKLIDIVNTAGVPYDRPVTRQQQYHMVRFFQRRTRRSLNLGYRHDAQRFIADFVFKGKSRAENEADRNVFLAQFGGEPGKRRTAFARLELGYSEVERLATVIRAYWALGESRGA